MTKPRAMYVADFETTTDPDDCRVWAYGLCELGDPDAFSVGTSIDHFAGIVSRHDCVVYFHNLRFDGVFILDYLFREGFTHSTEKYPGVKEFTTLISRQSQWYQLTVGWESGTRTEFRDSLKKLPMPVERVAKAFKLDEAKGTIDYDKPRPVGYVPDEDETDYIRKDVQIVAKAMQVQIANSAGKLTVGADAMAEYKSIMGNKFFTNTFPVLDVDMDSNIRAAYRGGWTYVHPPRQQVVQGSGHVYDVNSLYPSVMYDRLLPYGFPTFFSGEPSPTTRRPLWIASITFTAQLRPGMLPCIQVKGSFHFADTEYVEVIDEPITLAVTSVDFALWSDHYDIDVLAWNGGYSFTAGHGFFTDYVDKWSKIKADSEGGMREIAKLHLNSLYGKFGTNPDITGRVPVFEDDKVRLTIGPPDTRDPVYIPMGCFITAYAREVTVRAAQDNYETFAYADTDSLHLVADTEPDSLDIDPKRMGAWKHEYGFQRALYFRPKAYSEHLWDGSYETRIAGLPLQISSQVRIEDFHNGATWHGKLTPKNVPGGVVLIPIDYTLKDM